MDCFNNFIGIRSCDVDLNPRTGLFVEDLEGISLTFAASIAEQESGAQLLQDRLAVAYNRLKSDVLNEVQDYVRFNAVVENKKVGRYKETYLSTAALDRGVKITRQRSRLTKIHIQDVTIKVNDITAGKTFKIVDGDVETVFSFSGAAGEEVNVITDYTATRDEVLIVMDNSDVQVNESSVYESDCGCIQNNYRYFDVFGWNGTRTDNTTYGMQVNVSLECSDDDLICIFNHRLAWAALYQAGIQILNEAIESDRLNYITMFGMEAAMEKKAEWTELYKQELESKVDGIRQLLNSLDDECLMCRKNRILKQMP